MVKTIFLDIGEVLIGLNVPAAVKSVAAYSSLSEEQIRQRLQDHPDIVLYEKGELSTEEFHKRIAKLIQLDLEADEFKRAWSCIFDLESDQGRYVSPALFAALKQRCQLIALSNTNALHFDYLWDALPVVREFDQYVLSYQVGSVKPEVSIFETALKKTAATADELLFIDDQPVNVQAARKLGIPALQFENETSLRQQLEKLGLSLP